MPFPSAASFTQTKWLAFFAELTAKLTHHNVLVVMEGAELLKRLLISRVSIAAFLQQGELLVRLLDCWRGCVTADHPSAGGQPSPDYDAPADAPSSSSPLSPSPSATVALNDELSFVLAESISQCVDLMWSLYADGDAYYCLLVLARAGPMVEVLADVLQTAPPQLYGITASLLQQLLALPLGHTQVGMTLTEHEEHFSGLDKATLAQLHKSASLRRHLRSLVEAVGEHGALLQHCCDVLAQLLAVQQGPRCLAAVCLFNTASKRLRKYELRSGQHNTATTAASPSSSPGAGGHTRSRLSAHEAAEDDSQLNVTITGAPRAAAVAGALTSPSPSREAAKAARAAAAACALDDLEEGLETSDGGTSPPTNARRLFDDRGSTSPLPAYRGGGAAVVDGTDGQPQDISAVVDAEPTPRSCHVPPALADEALRHLTTSRSHEAFFDALDWLWCLTVADPAAVGAALTPQLYTDGLRRYMTTAPRTRRDRILFTLLLLWLGHLHSVRALRPDTHRRLLDTAAAALLPMLHAELSKEGGRGNAVAPTAATGSTSASLNVSAIPATNNTTAMTTSAMALAATAGYGAAFTSLSDFSVPGGPHAGGSTFAFHGAPSTAKGYPGGDEDAAAFADPSLLLPYAAARKAQEAALLLRPSIQVILLSFLLTIYAGSDAEARAAWVCKGRVLDVAAVAVRRAEGVRSALMDTPTTIDGALSDEVYLDYALRSVRTDVTTVAVLGSRLIAAVLGSELRWGTGWQEAKAPENATAAAGEEAAAGSAVVQAELALFCPAVMPALVHIAVNNPDVTAAQEGGAASPVHYVPSNLRCNRYTSLGESALVALDAVLQYYAQSGHLQARAGAAPVPTTAVSIEDLVRVLPAMARVSHRSVHPPVRALPYRCLLYISQRIEDVLVVLRDMPSLATAAVACVLDYSAASSQWEVAAAAEWLTVLVDLLTEAETQAAKGQAALQAPPPHVDRTFANVEEQEAGSSSSGGTRGRQRRHLFLSPAAQLNEFFHFDESPLARKLLASVAGARRNNAGSAYAMSAMLQLMIHLHAYLQNRQRLHAEQAKQRVGASVVPEVPAEAVTLPLLPAGHASLTQWVLLLQATTADNVRLTRICAAFHATASPRRDLSGHSTEGEPSAAPAHRPAPSTTVLKDAWSRALTASEQIALQYTFTASVFRALDCVLRDAGARDSAAGTSLITNMLLCNAVAAAVSFPTPGEVMGLLSRRFHASGSRVTAAPAAAPSSSSPPAAAAHNAAFASPSLVFGYQAAVQWACCVGAAWLRSAYPYQRQPGEQARTTSAGSSTGSVGGGLPRPCGASLLESFCDGCVTVMRDAAAVLSQRTRCHAAMLLSAVVEVCPGEHGALLEARGAEMLAASTELRRTPCVSALQCRLLRRVGSAARWAVHSGEGQEGGASWLQDNLDALRASVERIKGQSGTNPVGQSPRGRRQQQRSSSPQRCSAAVLARELQAFQVLTAVLASLVSCRGSLFVEGEEDTRKAGASLLSARQRQLLCAVLCDALSVPTLQHCVMAALPGMTDTEEGRRCFLTDISTAGDPLGRTLFGRVLALTFGMPCRWAGPAPDLRGASGNSSPLSTPQHRRSTSASPRSRSPAASHPTTTPSPQLRLTGDGQDGGSGSAETHSLVVVGCDVCTRLLTRRNGEEPAGVAGSAEESQAKADTRIPSGAFLAAFVKHRGVEYLARSILEVDRSQQQQGPRQHQRLALSLPLLRCLAALTLHTSVAREVVQNTDLFSVLLEVAGTAFASHAASATVALLALRNVCFDAGLKSTLCQESRVLLTLKAAGLRLQCVSYLMEDAAGWPLPGPTAASRPRSSAGAEISPSPRTSSQPRRVPVEVFLRSDVVDAANPSAAAWATQMCQIARTQRTESHGADAALRPSAVGAAFRDVTNAVPLSASDMSTVGAEAKAKGVVQNYAYATDAEASRRQYLAATALSSLWFDNQRGKAAIADALASVPAWSVEDVQASARTAAQV